MFSAEVVGWDMEIRGRDAALGSVNWLWAVSYLVSLESVCPQVKSCAEDEGWNMEPVEGFGLGLLGELWGVLIGDRRCLTWSP